MAPDALPTSQTQVAEYGSNLFYYLSLHLVNSATGRKANVPEEVSEIWSLLQRLPAPTLEDWRKVIKGTAGTKPRKIAVAMDDAEDDDAPRPGRRRKMFWTEEQNAHLVKLVEDEEYRTQKLGERYANHGLHPNFTAIARLLEASNGSNVKKHYTQLAGGKKPSTIAATKGAPATTPGSAWTAAQDVELQRLVREEAYRKEVLGKKHLKWSRIAEHFGHSKKSSRKRFTALTGEPAPE